MKEIGTESDFWYLRNMGGGIIMITCGGVCAQEHQMITGWAMRAADAEGRFFFIFSQIADQIVGALNKLFGDEVEGGIVKNKMAVKCVRVEDVVTLEGGSKVWSDVFGWAGHGIGR